MREQLIHLLSDYTFQIVALGTGFLGLLSGVVGTYVTLRKESLLGDALSHAALPGIAIAFLLIGRKEVTVLLLGAAVSGLIATWLIHLMSDRTVVKLDSALSLVLSSFFGLGLVFLTYIQRMPDVNHAGLSNFIFGQASAMLQSDVQMILIAGTVILVSVFLFWKEFKSLTFDPMFTKTVFSKSYWIEVILSTIIVVTIILGLESVGVILISALLIGPSIAARQWTNKLHVMMLISAVLGFISGVTGTFISSTNTQIPTGPSIVVTICLFVFISLFIAPKRGLIARRRMHKQKRKELIQEMEKVRGEG